MRINMQMCVKTNDISQHWHETQLNIQCILQGLFGKTKAHETKYWQQVFAHTQHGLA